MNDNDDNERRASDTMNDTDASSRHRVDADHTVYDDGGKTSERAEGARDTRSVLEAAEDMSGDRGNQYGGPEENMAAVCRLWNAYIDNKTGLPLDSEMDDMLEPSDVSQMMVLLKMARCQTGGTDRETLADEAGYVRVCAETEGVNGR